MYHVLLVDDEPIIVEGLRRVVDWEGHRCQVTGAAHDAASGTAAIRSLRPDILFTDVRMPDQTGLSMLAGLKSEFPQMQVCVLTGYRAFSYAQDALRLGVARYLLKPSKMDEINEALGVMVERLDRAAASAVQTAQQEDNAALCYVAAQAQAYISSHYMEKIVLQDVAEHCYVSQWHLSKLLKKHCGKGFYELVNDARIRRAKELLQDPSLRIAEIGARVGYADTGHFSRVFKSLAGVTANEYRNRAAGI